MSPVKTGGFKKAPPRPHIPEGEYTASILSAKDDHSFGPKVLIRLGIVCEGGDVILPFFCNVKLDPATKEMLEPSKSSKLARTLRRLFPGKPLADMSLDDLAGIACRVKVISSRLDADRIEKPPSEWYSVVSEIAQRLTDSMPEEGDIPF